MVGEIMEEVDLQEEHMVAAVVEALVLMEQILQDPLVVVVELGYNIRR
tara:strand:+ start:363 stop:506 length:144 start_codon:yes stop_codon:yes gene_type:complete